MSRLRGVDCVLDGSLYIGSLSGALRLRDNADSPITHVVSLCNDEALPTLAKGSKIKHMLVDIDDSHFTNLLVHLPSLLEFIETAIAGGGSVLVHCYMGVSRSAAVVSAYVMKLNKWPAKDAIEFVRERRSVIDPNDGFVKQLELFHQWKFAVDTTSPKYATFKEDMRQESLVFLGQFIDVFPFPGHPILMCQELPADLEQIEILAEIHNVTHFLEVPPSQPHARQVLSCQHFDSPAAISEDELIAYVERCCAYISEAILVPESRVFIHGFEDRLIRLVAAAYLVRSCNFAVDDAIDTTFLVSEWCPSTSSTKEFLREQLQKMI